ncbi:long-chain fatty acid--CoA ligase [Actinoplanes sp. TBRC 11911]|uniref:AMP-binding protein n=1 Tax=Actinoplanes sp. TBRC 11911 TaxID=2729386 RepID=UPI00145E7A50|nr:AMP-binding protein [Actinoplanes sp. TBRC 11911]NMO57556.1 long-chain fatty acid--CoA ligase [Actinoplanes sp. TBRC 11911]
MHLTQALHRALQQDERRPLTIFGDRVRSVAESTDRIARLAAGLRSLGVERGDRVALLGTNSDRFHESLLAVAWADAVVVPINHRSTPSDIGFALADCGARVLIVDDVLVTATRGWAAPLVVMTDGTAPAGTLSYEQLINAQEPMPDSGRGGEDLFGIFYTGGTTGRSKGVMLSHSNVLASAWGSLATGQFVTPGGRLLHAAPMFHLADLATWVAALLTGGTHVIVPGFSPDGVLAAVERHRVTDVLLVPTMIQLLVDFADVHRFDVSSLARLIYGGSPMPDGLLARAQKMFPRTGFVQAYGMTELAPVATLLLPDDHDRPELAGSAGRAAPHAQVRITGRDGAEVPRGTDGEIVVRGDHVMPGYWQRPEETAAVLRDGWMHTGDVGHMDKHGFVFVVDRLTDMIITGGENVYSAEVENVLVQHPAVTACAVIGLPDARWGERIHAVVVSGDPEVSGDHLQDFCRSRLAEYKVPRTVEFVGALPVSAAGKVLKRRLRDERLPE